MPYMMEHLKAGFYASMGAVALLIAGFYYGRGLLNEKRIEVSDLVRTRFATLIGAVSEATAVESG